jgi:hypothetical protein
MIELTFAYITFSIGYITLSAIQAFYKHKKLCEEDSYKDIKIFTYENEMNGIVLNTIKQEIEMPMIITPKNSLIAIPMGNGEIIEKEYFLFSKFNNNLIYYQCLDKTNNKSYIDTANDYNNLADRYDLKNHQINVKLPLAAYEYKLKNAYSICKPNKIGLIGTNKQKLINHFVYHTRLPLTFTIGLSGLALLVINKI